MVSVNNSTSGAEAHLPFGGNGKSGNGSRQSGIWVLDQFTRWQSMNWDYAGKLQKAQMDIDDDRRRHGVPAMSGLIGKAMKFARSKQGKEALDEGRRSTRSPSEGKEKIEGLKDKVERQARRAKPSRQAGPRRPATPAPSARAASTPSTAPKPDPSTPPSA